MRGLAAVFGLIALPALAAPDYSDGISGQEAAELVQIALLDAGITDAVPVVSIRPFPACPVTPEVSPHQGSWSTAALTCPSGAGWTRAVRTRARIAPDTVSRDAAGPDTTQQTQGPLMVAMARTMQRGDMITAGDVVLLPRGNRSALDTFARIEDVVGRRLKVSLGADQLLMTRHLDPDWAVRSGMPIALMISVGSFNVIASGEALTDGRVGDVIELRNLSSQKIVKGVVTGDNQVSLGPNIN